MVLRAFFVGLAVGALVAAGVSCGPVAPSCGPSTCSGCCTANDECVQATSAVSCGASGSACMQCQPGQQCLFGLCTGFSGTGGGTAGGAGGGTAGGVAGGTAGGQAGGSAGGHAGGSAGGHAGGSAGGSSGGAAGGGGVVPMRIFVTSVTYAGNLGGLAGADALCTTAAQAGNKGGTWKAWLSTSTQSAFSRQADVGPWYQQRSDGTTVLTFNNRANLATTPLVGVSVDEQGRPTINDYWTGTSGGGVSAADTCNGWLSSSSSYQGETGSAGSTSTAWTDSSYNYCYSSNSLLCLEQSHLPLPTPPPSSQRRVFITSVAYPGNLGGLAGADALCNTAAQAGNKSGTWKAWLSTSTQSAFSRQADLGPWYQERSDGTTVLTFNNKANLATTPLVGVSVDEQGRPTINDYWTGSFGGGVSAADTCNGWLSSTSSYQGETGSAGSTSTAWTDSSYNYCYSSNSLLCLEQ